MVAFVHVLGLTAADEPHWLNGVDSRVALALIGLNLLTLGAVYLVRLIRVVRARKTRLLPTRFERLLAEMEQRPGERHPQWLRSEIAGLSAAERPLVGIMLIARLRPASEEERLEVLDVLREVGGIDAIVRSTGLRMPWRRALAIETLGAIGAGETVPVLLERLSDRNRYVREAAVRALGRIGDPSVLPQLEKLYRAPGRVGTGIVYDALVALGPPAEPVFAAALGSAIESVRVASCFGVATRPEAAQARTLLEPLLVDDSPRVRAAAAHSLGLVGGQEIPDGLALTVRDQESAVRAATTEALGAYDDPRAVELAADALFDPDRETACRAAETLVRLSRRPAARTAAAQALERMRAEWPVEQAAVLASLGVV